MFSCMNLVTQPKSLLVQLILIINESYVWDFPGSQVLRLRTSTAGGMGSIPGWGTKILPVARYGKERKKERKEERKKERKKERKEGRKEGRKKAKKKE